MPTIENIRLHTFKESTISVWEKWENRLPLIIIVAIMCIVTYAMCVYPRTTEKPHYPYYED